MAVTMMTFVTENLLATSGILLLSSIPLYFGLRFAEGHVSLVKVLMVSMVLSIVAVSSTQFIGIFAGIIVLMASVVVYQILFKLPWSQAFLVWFLQYVFVVVVILVLDVGGLL
jgi:hypothetical protein